MKSQKGIKAILNPTPPQTPTVPSPKILVIRGGAIGDFILTLPALGGLRERWPQSRIEILGYPHIAELARERYYADAVRSISYGPMSSFFVPNSVLDPDLMKYFGSFEVVISYFFDPDELFAANLRRCGVKTLIAGPAKPNGMHAADHFTLPLDSLGISVRVVLPRIHLTETDRTAAGQFFSHCQIPDGPPQPVVALHAGSGSEKKNWPLERWEELCAWLKYEKKCEILLVGGDADESVLARLKPWACGIAKNLALPELSAVLARCTLFVGHDSGITHLAAASGTPTLVMFGSTNPATWRPLGEQVRVIFCEDEWKPTALLKMGTMADVPVSTVMRLTQEMLPADA